MQATSWISMLVSENMIFTHYVLSFVLKVVRAKTKLGTLYISISVLLCLLI